MRRISGPLFGSVLLLCLRGCGPDGQSYWLGQYEGHVDNGTRAITSARSDAARAAGHAERARGTISEQGGDQEKAFDDYTLLMTSDPLLGRLRFADSYRRRGGVRQREEAYEQAAADLEKSSELGADADGCSCEPYLPPACTCLVGLGQYDQSWDVGHKAQAEKQWIQPELLEQLKKTTGRER